MENSIYQRIDSIIQDILNGAEMSVNDGNWMLKLEDDYIPWLMAGADRIRKTFVQPGVEVCAISNVRSGNCSENCGFCAQSGHHDTQAPAYNFISSDELTQQATQARQWGASDFGVVSKGWGLRTGKERQQFAKYFADMKSNSDIGRCASLGVLTEQSANELKAMGLENYHHNLECAESFFANVCTTHSYQENIDTIINAQNAGLRVCCGGILGMGESLEQRIELADTLRSIGVQSVPLNFLNAQEGTPMADVTPMRPMEILLNIATFRYMLPKADIRIAGGRRFLGDMQSMIFMAGASGMMIGDYLTTQGRNVEDDQKMLTDLNLKPRGATQRDRAQRLEVSSIT
jgi:biotin synthase